MDSLIVGYGEVGQALYSILKPYYTIGYIDQNIEFNRPKKVEIMHICFGFNGYDCLNIGNDCSLTL